MTKVSTNYYIYAVKDSHGNTWIGVVDEPATEIQVYGMKDASGGPLYFESDAYHLDGWCKEHGLTCVATTGVASVEI
jgi:hypothetical protein